jgi:transcriptional regulator with XRE-family HTH domain
MARTKIDVQSLHAALDEQRKARDVSWRQLATLIGVSPSLLARLGNGFRPDADGFATLVQWLNMPAEKFMISEQSSDATRHDVEPELTAQLAPLLRARKDLSPADIEYLEDVIRATLRRAKADRDETRVQGSRQASGARAARRG